jgi:hypothetical protein
MATELREFLAELATDPKRLAEFMADADDVMEKAELAEDDRNLLKSGNLAGIQARLAGAVPPQIVVVIGLEQLQRMYTDAMRAMAPAGALPGAALWQQAPAGALPGAALWQQALPGAALWQQAPPGAALWQQAPPGAVAYHVAWLVSPFLFWWR